MLRKTRTCSPPPDELSDEGHDDVLRARCDLPLDDVGRQKKLLGVLFAIDTEKLVRANSDIWLLELSK